MTEQLACDIPWLPYYESRAVFEMPASLGGGWTAFCCGRVSDFATEVAAHDWCWDVAYETAEMGERE